MKLYQELKNRNSQLRWEIRFWWTNTKHDTWVFLKFLVSTVLKIIVVFFVMYGLLTLATKFSASTQPYDNTDPPNGRSGMSLHTDQLTGCQYLSRPFGGITPRLDKEGKQICNAVGS